MAPTVKAATGPTLTLSTSSGSSAMGDNKRGTVVTATLVTVTGTGFAGGQDNINVGYISLNSAVSASNFNAITLIRPSLTSSTTSTQNCVAASVTGATAGCVLADANGWFQAQFYVPELQAGTYQIVAQYTPTTGGQTGSQTMTSGASFTVNAMVAVQDHFSGATSDIYGAQVDLMVSGFQAGEQLSLAPTTLFVSTQYGSTAAFGSTALTTVSSTATSTCNYASVTTGRCSGTSAANEFLGYVTTHKGGTFTVSVTGGTSSITASTSFGVLPSVAFLNSALATVLSIPSSGASSMKIEGFGFGSSSPAATIPTNSLTITVGSTTTTAIMLSVSTDNFGDFPPTSFTVTQTMPTGLASVQLNGTTFSWTNANIQPPPAVATQLYADGDAYAGVLISSNTAGPSYLLTDATSYRVGYDYPYIFGVNFGASTTFNTITYTPSNGAAAAYGFYGGSSNGAGSSAAAITTSNDGAFLAFSATVVPSSYSSNNIVTFTTAGSGQVGTAAITATPVALWGLSGTGLSSATTSTLTVSDLQHGGALFNRAGRNTQYFLEVTGFKEATYGTPDSSFTVTLTSSSGVVTTWAQISGLSAATCTANTPPSNTNAQGTGTMCMDPSQTGGFPVAGDYIFNLGAAPDVAGGTYTLTVTGTSTGNTATLGVTYAPVVLGAALNVATPTTGNTVAFATTTTAGVHGLLPSTSYSVMIDGPTGTSVGTFTSTSSGQVPPGTQFITPAAASGLHVVDIVAAGSTTSAIYGSIQGRVAGSSQYTGYASSANMTTTSNSGTQGLTLTLSGKATLAPNVGTSGTVTTVSASGLTPNTAYYVVLSNDVSYASFTSTATGTIPSGVTFAFPSVPIAVAGDEQGEAQTVYISSKALHNSGVGASATFILQSSMTASANSATAGSTLTVNAKALANGQTYNIIFNYGVNSQGTAYTGTTVGSIVGGSDGSASGQFTVPANAASGSYVIQLVRSGCGTGTTCASLVSPPTLTVGGPSGIGTSTLTASGSATEASVSGQPTISQSFTNTASGALSVYMWVSVTNSAGQTVGVFLGSATIAAGATTTVGAALFNLPSGTYTATVFVTTTSGIVVSSTSTTSSFTV